MNQINEKMFEISVPGTDNNCFFHAFLYILMNEHRKKPKGTSFIGTEFGQKLYQSYVNDRDKKKQRPVSQEEVDQWFAKSNVDSVFVYLAPAFRDYLMSQNFSDFLANNPDRDAQIFRDTFLKYTKEPALVDDFFGKPTADNRITTYEMADFLRKHRDELFVKNAENQWVPKSDNTLKTFWEGHRQAILFEILKGWDLVPMPLMSAVSAVIGLEGGVRPTGFSSKKDDAKREVLNGEAISYQVDGHTSYDLSLRGAHFGVYVHNQEEQTWYEQAKNNYQGRAHSTTHSPEVDNKPDFWTQLASTKDKGQRERLAHEKLNRVADKGVSAEEFNTLFDTLALYVQGNRTDEDIEDKASYVSGGQFRR